MAVMVINKGADWNQEVYDKTIEVVIPDPANPPAGMISHHAAPGAAGLTVVDVWESAEAWDTFLNGTLIPAAQELQAPPFDSEILEIHNSIVR